MNRRAADSGVHGSSEAARRTATSPKIVAKFTTVLIGSRQCSKEQVSVVVQVGARRVGTLRSHWWMFYRTRCEGLRQHVLQLYSERQAHSSRGSDLSLGLDQVWPSWAARSFAT